MELAAHDAEVEARVLEAREAAAQHGADADAAARGIVGELRGEVERTRLAKAELRAQEEELREYIAELRGHAAGGARSEGGCEDGGGSPRKEDRAKGEELDGHVGHDKGKRDGGGGLTGAECSAVTVLRDVSNSSGSGAFQIPFLPSPRDRLSCTCLPRQRSTTLLEDRWLVIKFCA